MDSAQPHGHRVVPGGLADALRAIDLRFELWAPSRALHRRVALQLIALRRTELASGAGVTWQSTARVAAWLGEPRREVASALAWLAEQGLVGSTTTCLGRARWRADRRAELVLEPELPTVLPYTQALRVVPDPEDG